MPAAHSGLLRNRGGWERWMLYAVVVLQQAALVLSGEHVRPPPPPPHHPQPEPEPEPEPELEPEPEPCGHEGHEGHEGHAASEGGEHAGCGEHHGPHRIPAWFPIALAIFWLVLLWLIMRPYSCLRKKNEAAYEEFQKKRMEEAEDDDDDRDADGDHEVADDVADGGVELSTREMIKEYGLDGALYLSYLELCAKFWALHSVTTCAIACVGYQILGDRVSVFDAGLPIYALSMANVDPTSAGGWFSVLIAFWLMCSGVLFAIWRNKQMDKLKLDADEDLHTSRCTCWLKSVPTHVTDETLHEWLDKHHPDQVAGASVALNVHELGKNIRKQKQLINKINRLQDAMSDMPDDAKVAKISTLKELLALTQSAETALRDKEYTGSGHAFITFKTEDQALSFKGADRSADVSGVEAASWKVMMAPVPGEIYWENMGFSKSDRVAQKFKMGAVVLTVFVIFIMWALVAVLSIGFQYMGILYTVYPTEYWGDVRDKMSDIFTEVGSYIIGFVCFIIFLGMEEEMAPVVKYISKTSAPTTKSKKQSIYLGFQYGFYLIYHLLLSTCGLAFLVWACEDDDRPRLYVEMVAAFHINRMFLTSCLIDAFHAFEGVKFIRRPTKSLTAEQRAGLNSAEAQEDIDDAMHEDDPFFNNKFDYTRNYAESLAVFSVAMYYGTMHPLIMPAIAAYYYIKGALDRMQVKTQYSKPSLQYGRRARTTTKFMLCSTAIGTVGNVIYYVYIAPLHDPEHHKEGVVSNIAYGFVAIMLMSWGIYFAYTNKLQKKLFGSKDRAKKKAELRKSRHTKADQLALENGFTEMPYAPPRPDDMQIGVKMSDDEIRDTSPLKFDNPLDEDESY